MNYNWNQCKYDPTVEAIYDSYPDLFEKLGVCCKDERMVRYIIAVYDPVSPLVKAEPSLPKRKQAALVVVGYNELVDDTEAITELATDEIVQAIVTYLFNFTNSRVWAKVVVNEQLYEEYCKRLLQPVQGMVREGTNQGTGPRMVQEKDELQAYQIKAKLREELDTIGTALDGYYKQIFAGDDQLAKKNNKRFTPEQIAGL